MVHEFIMAGFGGQGIMFIGQLLAYAGMMEGRKVSWLPSYGPEMRGGTANCCVVISDEEVCSPVVTEPTSLVVMNQPSLDRFEPAVRPGGLLVLNSSLIGRAPRRTDLRVMEVPANRIAGDLGSDRVANMVVLGALVKCTGAVRVESLRRALWKVLPPHRHDLIPVNESALERGFALAG